MIVCDNWNHTRFVNFDNNRYYYISIDGSLRLFDQSLQYDEIEDMMKQKLPDFRGMFESWKIDLNEGIPNHKFIYPDERQLTDTKLYLFKSYLIALIDSVMKRGKIEFDFHKAFTRLNLSMCTESVSLKAEQRFLDGKLITYYTNSKLEIDSQPLLLQELYGVILSDQLTVVS